MAVSVQPSAILLRNGLLATFSEQDDLLSKPVARRVDVLITGDRITAIAEPSTVQSPPDTFVIDCTHKWIAPGFVDTHRLAPFTTTALTTADDIYAGQLAGCLQALNGGTTTVLDHFHAANSPAHIEKATQATVESGIRSMFCLSRGSWPTSLSPLRFDDDVEISKMQLEILRTLAEKDNGRLCPDGRVTLGLAYDGQGRDPDEDKRILSLARNLGVKPITMHYVGGPHGAATAYKVRKWAEAGLLQGDCVFSHGNGLVHPKPDLGEWELLKESGASIASTPVNELGMGHGNPIPYECIRRGVTVGLGIVSRIHENLSTKSKATAYNNCPAASAFRLATLGGAEAAHVSSQLGSIEVGKLADFAIYDSESVNLAGCVDPFRGIVFHATGADVEFVIVNGEIVKKGGILMRKDWKEVATQLKHRAGLLRERAAQYDLDQRYTAVMPILQLPVA
ncbi:Metallo-dependent hydrolase [Gloeophyllum trabeum ATCC 11539]|uniref:Metallo-dependent hydrolase n=1 Tax=Gloeophyllum trabeum (strain ATCC 11539 / FP-39264 / Madison 617) TaxID=670483 RepID=S7RJQ7_GLOTA|nr:Metallo-dependent hydrolase [Gloeophyllum trabeum ATCC 11539]EPQ52874.1 Metallo-dependent hydrolase [Gloeophyllum trabeum ATCC 11539]